MNANELTGFQEKLAIYLRAGYPILYVVTPEEDRAIDQIIGAVEYVNQHPSTSESRRIMIWSVAQGLCDPSMSPLDRSAKEPSAILPKLLERKEPSVTILEDFHFFQDERANNGPVIIRQMRDLAAPFCASQRTVVMLSPVLRIPTELEKEITVLDLDLPSQEELTEVLERTIEGMPAGMGIESSRLGSEEKEKIVMALSGLTTVEAENALAKVTVSSSRLDTADIDDLLAEKEQIIRKSGLLEFYASPEQFGTIGGLSRLKDWLRERGRAFSDKAREFGLPFPKGLLLVGVPGCGKSLSAKAVAAEWQMPLLRFDLGKVFASKVGEAEENMRKALRMAEGVAPCLLWIDEVEKGLAGVGGGANDSGVAQRVFGTLLTWMEENDKAVFIIATANNINGLPPELLRKGRFNEIFFIDLPTPSERVTIFKIHLKKAGRDPSEFDVVSHAFATEGFNGAEIEQVVIAALYKAFNGGEMNRLEDEHLNSAITDTVPLSQSMEKQISMLREQAATRWRMASPPAEEDPIERTSEPTAQRRTGPRRTQPAGTEGDGSNSD